MEFGDVLTPEELRALEEHTRMITLPPAVPSKSVVLIDLKPRPSWDEIWMSIAGMLALRSTCRRTSVGCVVVSTDNTTVLGLGYNGGPEGLSNDCLSDEPGKCGHLHAEINALIKTTYHSVSSKKVYLTLSPCYGCAVALVNARVSEVVFRELYRDAAGLRLLSQKGIPVRQFDPARVSERDLYLNEDRP